MSIPTENPRKSNIQRPPSDAFAGDINGARAIGSWLGHDLLVPETLTTWGLAGMATAWNPKLTATLSPKIRGSTKIFQTDFCFNPAFGQIWTLGQLWIPESLPIPTSNQNLKSKITPLRLLCQPKVGQLIDLPNGSKWYLLSIRILINLDLKKSTAPWRSNPLLRGSTKAIGMASWALMASSVLVADVGVRSCVHHFNLLLECLLHHGPLDLLGWGEETLFFLGSSQGLLISRVDLIAWRKTINIVQVQHFQ